MNEDLRKAAVRAVEDNPRHDYESLFKLLNKWFPERHRPDITVVDILRAIDYAFGAAYQSEQIASAQSEAAFKANQEAYR